MFWCSYVSPLSHWSCVESFTIDAIYIIYGFTVMYSVDGLAHSLSSDYQASYLYGLHHKTNPVLT